MQLDATKRMLKKGEAKKKKKKLAAAGDGIPFAGLITRTTRQMSLSSSS